MSENATDADDEMKTPERLFNTAMDLKQFTHRELVDASGCSRGKCHEFIKDGVARDNIKPIGTGAYNATVYAIWWADTVEDDEGV